MNRQREQQRPEGHPAPALVVMVGPPGTGKSHLVRELALHASFEVIQTDEIRLGLSSHPRYTEEENTLVFAIAHRRTERALRGRRSVVFDATNIHEYGRRTLYRIAERSGARLLIVHTMAPDDVVEKRLRDRAAGLNPADRSEAGWEVYLRMKREFEEIQRPHMVVDTSLEMEPAVQEISQFLNQAT